MTDFVRGTTIHFAAKFKDANGVAFTPSAPVIVITYPTNVSFRPQSTSPIALTEDGGAWVADWDSKVAARAGTCTFTVYSSTPNPKVAVDGMFRLLANDSNLVAV